MMRNLAITFAATAFLACAPENEFIDIPDKKDSILTLMV